MKKLTAFILGSVVLFGAVACDDNTARTDANAPENIDETPETPTASQVQDAHEDTRSGAREDQLDADIRAREERNNMFNDGSAVDRNDSDLASEVRSKLEANLPASLLVVESEDAVITISGTVPTEEQLERIEPLALEIKGVQSVNNQAIVAPAQPDDQADS